MAARLFILYAILLVVFNLITNDQFAIPQTRGFLLFLKNYLLRLFFQAKTPI